ncbi:MAG: hypothetical protein AB7O66_22690, partial [Limisphaerales bacterium]
SSRCPEPSTLATSSHHPTFVRATITRFSNRSFYLVSSPLRTRSFGTIRIVGALLKRSPSDMEGKCDQELSAEFKTIRRGWCLGEETFRRELPGRMSGRIGAEDYGSERGETDEEKTEGIIAAELRPRGWTEATFRERAKGDAEKVRVEEQLRAETGRTVKWVAERLHLGSRAYAQQLLWRAGKSRHDKNKN